MTKTRERSRRVQKEKGKILKRLIARNTGKTGGRNNLGRVTSFHRGGGAKRLHRLVDLKRDTPGTGVVERIEYDPNRSSRIALVRWVDGPSHQIGRRAQSKIEQDLPPPASGKDFESPVSSVFSFSSIPGGVEQKMASSCVSLSQAKRLPPNYVMIGDKPSETRGFISSSSSLVKEAGETGVAPSLSFPVPRIAVAGAKPNFFAPRAIGDEAIGENLTLDEIQKWKNKSIDRKVAISWQTPGLVESKPKAGQASRLIPTQVLGYGLSRGQPLYENELPVKPNTRAAIGRGANSNSVPVSYIVASDKLEAGQTVKNCDWSRPSQSTGPSGNADTQGKLEETSYDRLDLSLQVGNCMPLADMRMGTWVHNIELRPGQGAKMVRAAGTHAKVIKAQGSQTLVRLPSGVEKLIDSQCRATVGTVSNPDHSLLKLRKAGQNRWLGWRPVVRGVAMNPVDHPHGGGEGRTSGGRPSVSPWGKPTKGGFKTVLKAVTRGRA